MASQSAWRCWLHWRSADGSSCCPSTAGSSFSSRSGSAAVLRWLVTTPVGPCCHPLHCCSLQPRRRHNGKITVGRETWKASGKWKIERDFGGNQKEGDWKNAHPHFQCSDWMKQSLGWSDFESFESPGEYLFLLPSLLENNASTKWSGKTSYLTD